MSKQVEQSTRFETRTVTLARQTGRLGARREPKTGIKHEPDVFIPGREMRAALTWENWSRGGSTRGINQRRTATRMVVISEEHFNELLALDLHRRYGYHVQCKSTQALSVRLIFEGLVVWMKERS